MRDRIEAEFAVLLGKPLRYAGRASLMAWFGFGDIITIPDREEGSREVAEYALHLQCTWRIRGPARIVTGATDLFHAPEEPYEELENEEWGKKVGDRLYVTLCDARLTSFFQKHGDDTLIVEGITADAVGSLQIALKGGYSLDVFPDGSLPSEHWRFFRPRDQSSHLVVTGAGIEEYED